MTHYSSVLLPVLYIYVQYIYIYVCCTYVHPYISRTVYLVHIHEHIYTIFLSRVSRGYVLYTPPPAKAPKPPSGPKQRAIVHKKKTHFATTVTAPPLPATIRVAAPASLTSRKAACSHSHSHSQLPSPPSRQHHRPTTAEASSHSRPTPSSSLSSLKSSALLPPRLRRPHSHSRLPAGQP